MKKLLFSMLLLQFLALTGYGSMAVAMGEANAAHLRDAGLLSGNLQAIGSPLDDAHAVHLQAMPFHGHRHDGLPEPAVNEKELEEEEEERKFATLKIFSGQFVCECRRLQQLVQHLHLTEKVCPSTLGTLLSEASIQLYLKFEVFRV